MGVQVVTLKKRKNLLRAHKTLGFKRLQKMYRLYRLYKPYSALVADFDRPSALVLNVRKTQ